MKKMRKIMRATLHDRSSNPYYGHWLARLLGNSGQKAGANAHWDFGASATFEGRERASARFLGNRGSAPRKFTRA
jgi:hypothetical protein